VTVPKGDVLTSGEQAMVGIFAGLYGIAFIFTFVMFFGVFRTSPTVVNMILFLFTMMTFLFRCIYLSIYVSGGLREEGPSSYVLVEPPSFFILSVASILIMSYGFCVYCLSKSVPHEAVINQFWMWWLAFTVFLYLILVVVLTLLCTLDSSALIVSDCYGRMVTTESNFTVQSIRIAYHTFLLVIAIISAVTLFFLGRTLRKTLKTDTLSHLSIISGISVLSTSVLWVVYSALSGSSPYFVIPLWCCEVLPLVLVCFLSSPFFLQQPTASTFSFSFSKSVESVNSM
jgi:hypothetical protein